MILIFIHYLRLGDGLMFRFSIFTIIIVIIELGIYYYLSRIFNLEYYDVLFIFGALTSGLVFFFVSRGDVYEKRTNHSVFMALGRTLGYDNMKTDQYSVEMNPLLFGSLTVTLVGSIVSLLVYLL